MSLIKHIDIKYILTENNIYYPSNHNNL